MHYDALDSGPSSIEFKLATIGKTIWLRDQVNKRFFSFQGSDNRSHVHHILRLQWEQQGLEKKKREQSQKQKQEKQRQKQKQKQMHPAMLTGNTTGEPSRPLLPSPSVPTSAPSHTPTDSLVVDKRQAADGLRAARIQKLYDLWPALDDSSALVADDKKLGRMRASDERDRIIRLVFRELVAQRADADVLSRATTTSRIDRFLRESSTDNVENYVFFFERLREGRPDTLRLLRDAICDFFMRPSTTPGTTAGMTGTGVLHLLGGTVSATNIANQQITQGITPMKMPIQGWRLLYIHFHNVVTWQALPLLAARFDELVAVKTLTVCEQYGEKIEIKNDPVYQDHDDNDDDDDHSNEESKSWYVPHKDIALENCLASLHGFIAVEKSAGDDNMATVSIEQEARCYLVGRMSKQDPMAPRLAHELSKRVASLITFVFDGEGQGELGMGKTKRAPHLNGFPPPPRKEETWILRSRPAQSPNQHWTVLRSLSGVVKATARRDRRDSMTARDYYEFYVISRTPGLAVNLLDVVSDALKKLKGDLSDSRVLQTAVVKFVPVEQLQPYLESAAKMVRQQRSAVALDTSEEGVRPGVDVGSVAGREWSEILRACCIARR